MHLDLDLHLETKMPTKKASASPSVLEKDCETIQKLLNEGNSLNEGHNSSFWLHFVVSEQHRSKSRQ